MAQTGTIATFWVAGSSKQYNVSVTEFTINCCSEKEQMMTPGSMSCQENRPSVHPAN
jgi:hypothetical protein